MVRRCAPLLLLLLALASPAWGAWAHTQSNGEAFNTSASTIAHAYTSNIGSGSPLLVCGFAWYNSPAVTLSSVADSLVQTWTQAGSTLDITLSSQPWRLAIGYFAGSASGANTVTATLSGTSAIRWIACSEYSGIDTSSPLDKTTGQQQATPGTGTDAVSSGNTAATAQNNELVFSTTWIGQVSNDVIITGGTNFTKRFSVFDTGVWGAIATEDRNLATAGVVAGTYTISGGASATANPGTIVATFKQAAAGGGPPMRTLTGVGL